jgi:hypothetical protein
MRTGALLTLAPRWSPLRLLMGPAASADGVTECRDELNTYAQVRLDLYFNRPPRLPDQPTPEPPICRG